MDANGLVINIAVGLWIGLVVNWLADRLPGYGQTQPVPVPDHPRRRWLGVFAAGLIFGAYLTRFMNNPANGSPTNPWILWLGFALFLLILVVDVEHRRVLNVVVYPMLLLGVALAFVRAEISPASALLGGLLGFGLFFLLFLLRPGGLGAGDVKLAALIGVLLGFPSVLVALVTAIGLGGVGALVLLLSHRIGLRGTMAYAPYLSIGAMIGLLYGPAIVTWYLERLGIS
jgi:leader peptidase (prepilin peptidase)/N-methyltransferase